MLLPRPRKQGTGLMLPRILDSSDLAPLVPDVIRFEVDADEGAVGHQCVSQSLAGKRRGVQAEKTSLAPQGLAALVVHVVPFEADFGDGAVGLQSKCQCLEGKANRVFNLQHPLEEQRP